MQVVRRYLTIIIAASTFLSGLGVGYLLSTLYSERPEYTVGIVYPMSGRLDWWAGDGQPIIDAAKRDVQEMLNETGSDAKFLFPFADSRSTGEGALAAVENVVAAGSQIVVGLPTSFEVEAALAYVSGLGIPVISPASTASHLSIPDSVFRLSTPENYRARIGAELALSMNFTQVVVIHRDEDWGNAYAETVTEAFQEKDLPTYKIPFEPSHTFYRNYSSEVKELETLVQGEEHTLAYLVAWENEDYSILDEARRSPTLSGIRWLTAAMYPSLIERVTMFGMAEDLRDFALTVDLWAPEQRPIVNDLTVRLMEESRSRLGHYPSYEHVYLYDSVMIAARALLAAGSGESDILSTVIPQVAETYFGATGHKPLDANGDLQTEDTAFIGVVKEDDAYELGYYAFHAGSRDEFTILGEPQERSWFFSPQA
ncbi:MAG: ABC transporter substrate-binding protein [Thermoplasmata archaeon]